MGMFDHQEFEDGTYDTAQVCANGHLITESIRGFPEQGQKFCQTCGAKTLTTFEYCSADIRGHLRGVLSIWDDGDVPSFCSECGKPYPWTSKRLAAAKILVEETENLDEQDKLLMKASLDDISTNSPMTEVAVVRIKKFLRKIPGAAGEALKRAAIDVASDAAKKILTGGG